MANISVLTTSSTSVVVVSAIPDEDVGGVAAAGVVDVAVVVTHVDSDG